MSHCQRVFGLGDLWPLLENTISSQRNANLGPSEVPQRGKTILVRRKYFLKEADSKGGDIFEEIWKRWSQLLIRDAIILIVEESSNL